MAVIYKYKAIDTRGKIRHDSIEADNLLDLEQRVTGMGMELINFRQQRAPLFEFRRRRASLHELINFTFQMQQLTRAGVTILDGLADLRDSAAEGRMKEVLSGLIDEIQGGKTFSEALGEFPDIFDRVYIALVRVGEESGRLSEVLHDMAETLKWHDELISRMRKIMIYPAIVSLVIISVVSYIMLTLVPQLIPFIRDIGGEIPLHTQALIATSSFLGNYWYLVFGLPIAGWLTLREVARRKPEVRMQIDTYKLRLYIFGPLLLKADLARFSNYFAMMYTSGLTVLDCLKISEQLVHNAAISKSIRDARERVSDGEQISSSFSMTKLYPALVIRMLKVGENTGAMDDALLNISYFYNREVREAIDKMEAVITPALTILLGLVMLWVMISVLGPVYDTLSRIQF